MAKSKLYADENIEAQIIESLRIQKVNIKTANELGFSGRDDQFHFQQARKRKAILLTRDTGFLDNRKYPYQLLRDIAIVVLCTEKDSPDIGYALAALVHEVVPSGRANLAGLKIELRGPRMVVQSRIGGSVKRDEIDMRKDIERVLFTADQEV